MIIRLILMGAGVILLLSAGRLSPFMDRIAGNVEIRGDFRVEAGEDDEILNNKTKWKLIVAGYIFFLLVSIFSVVSVFTLNNKINTLYKSVQELESRDVSAP